MGTHSYVRDTVESDIHALKDNLREIDKMEVDAVTGKDPEHSLRHGLEKGLICKTIVYKEKPVAMFGVADANSDFMGAVWLLGTDEVKKTTDILVKRSKEMIDMLFNESGKLILVNYISVENKLYIKWLKAIGFIFCENEYIYGTKKKKFKCFFKYKKGAK